MILCIYIYIELLKYILIYIYIHILQINIYCQNEEHGILGYLYDTIFYMSNTWTGKKYRWANRYWCIDGYIDRKQ